MLRARQHATTSRSAADLWSLSADRLHLNHGSFGAVPTAVIDAQHRLRLEMEAAPVAWFGRLPGRIAEARLRVAQYLGSDSEGIALVTNVSAGVSAVLASMHLRNGVRLLVTDHGYGAVSKGAERVARRHDGQLATVHIPLAADELECTDRILAAVGEETDVVIIDQVTSPTARMFPVDDVCEQLRRRGVISIVDGAHAPGMIADPVCRTADFWVGNLHKFACAPRGTAALYARPEHRDLLHPLIDSWGAGLSYPERFDFQGTTDATGWLAAPNALELIEAEFGWDAVRAHNERLVEQGADHVGVILSRRFGTEPRANLGGAAPGMALVPLPSGIVSTREEADALRDRVARELAAEVAFTAFDREGYLRLSAHIYNTPDDYEAFAERLVPLLDQLVDERTRVMHTSERAQP